MYIACVDLTEMVSLSVYYVRVRKKPSSRRVFRLLEFGILALTVRTAHASEARKVHVGVFKILGAGIRQPLRGKFLDAHNLKLAKTKRNKAIV